MKLTTLDKYICDEAARKRRSSGFQTFAILNLASACFYGTGIILAHLNF